MVVMVMEQHAGVLVDEGRGQQGGLEIGSHRQGC